LCCGEDLVEMDGRFDPVHGRAVNGGSVDDAHTLITAWDDPSNLVPAIVAVFEPGTLALLSTAIVAIDFSTRAVSRRNSRRR
jgi:hypothetical protein